MMTIESLIKQYKQNPKMDLKKLIKRKYVPYVEKMAVCNNIVETSCHKEVEDRKLISINSPMRYILFVMNLLMLYTDLEIVFDNGEFVKQYDKLSEGLVLQQLLQQIPENEYAEFSTLLNMTMDDFRDNEYGICGMMNTLKESLAISGDVLKEVLEEALNKTN